MIKDTPEGQTHYENDGCGEPAHNKANLRERFKEQFRTAYTEKQLDTFADWWMDKFTTHTKKLLQAEIERLEGRDEIIKEPNEDLYAQWDLGYNQALQDQISLLQEQIININKG